MANKLLICLLVLALGVSACAPLASANTPRAWFDGPLPQTLFVPPIPCQIVAHGSSPAGIAQFELSINGDISAIPATDNQSALVTLTRDCGLSQPGEYLLLLRVQDNAGNWSGYAETSLIIPAGETLTPTGTPTPATFPPLGPVDEVSIVRVSTHLVYLGRADCGPLAVTVTAHAVASTGIKVVMLFYRFETGGSAGDFLVLTMNPLGGDLFESSLDPNALLGGSVPFDQAVLQYQVVVQQNNDDTSLRTPVLLDIAVKACT
jgi:hypothetical protein